MSTQAVFLCPGQGAQAVGMGASWIDGSQAAARIFRTADQLAAALPAGGRTLSQVCRDGPQEVLNRTDVSQPALFACGMACHAALLEAGPELRAVAAAGLSLGEYTALCIAGAFSVEEGVRLVATRGQLMQAAAEASEGGMVAVIGASETQVDDLCAAAAQGEVLVPANFNAPGQVVVSGSVGACDRAVQAASSMGLRAQRLQVAGAFHSPLMEPAAEGMAKALREVDFRPLQVDVWSNVTAARHPRANPAAIKESLVKQLVSPVRWSQSCADMIEALKPAGAVEYHELAPNTVLKGLMRRIDKTVAVATHDNKGT